jgi:hypothetical protein
VASKTALRGFKKAAADARVAAKKAGEEAAELRGRMAAEQPPKRGPRCNGTENRVKG